MADPAHGMAAQAIDPDWPEGFALVTETRRITLPAGEPDRDRA